MTERAILLLDVVMDMISGALDTMSKDQFYSPPTWIMENWWNTLSIVRREITSAAFEVQPTDDSDVQVP
jgi:hypothetical protein